MKDLRFDKTDKMQYKDEGNTNTDRKLIDSVVECIVAAASEMNDNLYIKICRAFVSIYTDFCSDVSGDSLKLIITTIYGIMLSKIRTL